MRHRRTVDRRGSLGAGRDGHAEDGRVFRYATGHESVRAVVAGYARTVGVPESQLDWGDQD